MISLRLAAALFALYALALAGDAWLYLDSSGDKSEIPRAAARVLGLAAAAWGLWGAQRWAWWAGLLAGGALAVANGLALYTDHARGLFASRPDPAAQDQLVILGLAGLVLALALLLLPESRAAVESSN